MVPPGMTCAAQRCLTNPVGADLGRLDVSERFVSRSTSMARISEADAGTLSNTKASRKSNAGVVLAEVLVSVKFLRSPQGFGFGDTRAKLLPRHQRNDRFISILLVIAAGDQRGANTCEETDFVIDCP